MVKETKIEFVIQHINITYFIIFILFLLYICTKDISQLTIEN